MEKFFCMGVAFGMMAGALLAVNSAKVRKLVCEGQMKVCESAKETFEEKKKRKNQDEIEE